MRNVIKFCSSRLQSFLKRGQCVFSSSSSFRPLLFPGERWVAFDIQRGTAVLGLPVSIEQSAACNYIFIKCVWGRPWRPGDKRKDSHSSSTFTATKKRHRWSWKTWAVISPTEIQSWSIPLFDWWCSLLLSFQQQQHKWQHARRSSDHQSTQKTSKVAH